MALGVFAALVLVAGLRFAETPAPNIILITVDSLSDQDITAQAAPSFHDAAQQALRYPGHRAVSASPATNLVSLLSGTLPVQHRVLDLESEANLSGVMLEGLRQKGYLVGGSQAFMLAEPFSHLGIDVELERDPLVWIAKRIRDEEAFFYWYHYADTGLPYIPASHFRARGDGNNRQNSAVLDLTAFAQRERTFEQWFTRFWRFFEESGLRENTVLVVVGTQGREPEGCKESCLMSPESLHMPLVVWGPPGLLEDIRDRIPSEGGHHGDLLPAVYGALGGGQGDNAGEAQMDDPGLQEWVAITRRLLPGGERHELLLETIEGSAWIQHRYSDGMPVEVQVGKAPKQTGSVDAETVQIEERRATARIEAAHEALERYRPDVRAPVAAPEWRSFGVSGVVTHEAFRRMPVLEWSGKDGTGYVVAYAAGQDDVWIQGQYLAEDPRINFETVSASYWANWVQPLREVRARVRPAEDLDAWSEWLVLELKP